MKEDYQVDLGGKVAKGMLVNKPISLKYSVELAREINGKPVGKAVGVISNILSGSEYLPLKKYNKKVPHRAGNKKVKAGKYPKRVCEAFLELIANVKNNAAEKGLDEDNLLIAHVFASHGFRRRGMQPKGNIAGKIRRRKSTHLEMIVREMKG